LYLATASHLLPSLGYALLISVFYALAYLTLYQQGYGENTLLLESLVEGNMVLAGLIAFLWDPYHGPF
ncbi:MAG: hypothetical protein PHW74_14720, partial [Desulfobacca sp.]|nr:hypothetical protein [Desulfobacca sp.]